MINWSTKHITLITIFFFTAYVGVFTTNALCDLEIIEYAPNLAHNHTSDSKNDQHQGGHSHAEHAHDSHSDSSQEDTCCDDVTSQLESALFSKILKNQTVEAKYFLVRRITLTSKLVSFFQNHILYHEYDDPPPITGFDIRVLVQSFLN